MAVVGRPSKIGKYDVVEVLGEGGMAAVYKAVDPRIGRTVAIKVIKTDLAEDPEFRRRFDTEARAVGNLQHPNIVTVYEFGEENGRPYLVMQYLDGTPLDKVIAQRQNLPIIHKLDIIIGVLKALEYAHEHGVIHRDVKPANVHLLKDGSVKLLDFGIAREGNLGQTKTGQVIGTMLYMPPEQMNGQLVDPRGDIFSTGIMLFELLAYSLPFDSRDQTALVVQRLRGDPPPPLSKYFENYPIEMDDIIAQAMMRDPADRYTRAEEFAFDLVRVQERLKRDMAGHRVEQARALIAKSDWAEAKKVLSEVVRIDTQNSTAKQLLYEVQQSLQAQQRLEKVQQLRVQAEDALSSKKLERAAELVEEAIRIDKNNPELLELRERVQEAKARAQQVLKLLKLASAAQQSEQFEVAEKAVADALVLDSSDTDAKVMLAAIRRQLVEHEKQSRVQQLLQAARREIAARQLEAAQENIGKAKAIDPAHPEIPGLEKMILAGQEQQRRRTELQQVCAEIEQCLVDNKLTAARDLAGKSLRKFPGEERLIRLKAAADEAYEQEQRRRYIEQQIVSASRLVGDGQASSALKLLQDAERLYPAHPRLLEYMKVVREAAAREAAEQEKKGILLQAAAAIRRESFAEAVNTLERGLLQFPADTEIGQLLKNTRDELDRANQKKRVEEVSRQARKLLETKAHTDAINLLERSVAQVSDPDLVRLLEYARGEAADYHTALRHASEQASKMLDEARPADAVSFLEKQVGTYGKDAGFQALLSKAHARFEDAQQVKRRILGEVDQARWLLRSGDLQGAEAIFHRCQAEASSEPNVMALGNEIEEEKEAVERRRQEEAEWQSRKMQERAAEESQPVASDPRAGTKIFPEGAESQAVPLHEPPAGDATSAHIKTGKPGRLEHEAVQQRSEGVFQGDLSEAELSQQEERAKHERWAPLPLKTLTVAGFVILLATGAFFAKRWWDHRPPAVPKQFEVKIESDPPHALIHIKGPNLTCETPCSGLMLPPGNFEMEATLENYQTMTQPVKIPDQVRVRFNLDPVPPPETHAQAASMVSILIQTVVGALVTVDDKQYRTKNDGTLRLSVAANSTHRIRAQKEGFKPREQVVPVGGDNSKISLELTPDLVTVLVRKAPPGATVLVDEKPQATVTKDGTAKFQVTAGDHGFALSTASGTAPPVSRSAKTGQVLSLDSLPVPAVPVPVQPSTDSAELEWERVKDSNNPAELQSFLDHYPVSPHADAVRTKIDQLDGNSALGTGSRTRLLDYLNKHPNGQYVEQCRSALDEIEWKAVENSNDLAKLQEFVDSHPTSRFKSQALAKIADVRRSTAPMREASPMRETNNDSNAIQTVLNTYAGALQDRNRLRLRHVYPGLDDKSFDKMKQSFDNAESIKVQLKITNGPVINGNGTTAHVSCDQLIEVKTHGETQILPRTVLIFSLVKDNGEWIIDNVTRPR